MAPLELWGGLECTVNRTGDVYLDQSRLAGHHDRPGDLDLFAGLGIRALRYPVLWERVAPEAPDRLDWAWADERLERLRALGVRPIVGLVHHGSGPRYTNLLDDAGFASGLGAFAGQVARRYPWVVDWTPVNEPLTTARFSALYGHWYPHHRDEGSFWRALLNQVDATREAMRAIRLVNPAARLVQTDDLGRTYATLPLAEQAAFDNLRRWAGWDLLFGRVTPHHPLWERLDRLGLGDRLRVIADDPCPPDIVGVNHYLTSDRFLDHRLQRYPAHTHGGNDVRRYADTEAVRVLDPAPAGFAGALREAWQRYRTALAITEVHNGCTREEQMRWAAEAWDTARLLRHDGIDVRAVTAWALLGSHSWNTLLTRKGVYEPGVFDASVPGEPRPTALAALWRGLPDDAPRHPVAQTAGWWHRPDRLTCRPIARPARRGDAAPCDTIAPVLVTGATGTLGQAFARALSARNICHVLVGRREMDLTQPDSMAALLARTRPWAVIDAAGFVRVDDAETQQNSCWQVNATGAIALADACHARGIAHLAFSSDLVFDGASSRPYVESDAPAPLCVYGRSKAALEAACAPLPRSLVVRTAAFFSPFDLHNFAVAVADAVGNGGTFAAAHDHLVTPSFVPQLVEASLDLLIDGARGIWHLANDEPVSWAEFARRVAVAIDADPNRVLAVPGATLGWRAARPRYAALASERGPALGRLDDAIAAFAARYQPRTERQQAA